MQTLATYEIANITDQPARVQLIQDCAGFRADVQRLNEFSGKFNTIESGRTCKTARGALKSVVAVLKCHRIQFAY
jgi:hypothetical protein